jgi:hypothetical protein
MWGRGAVLHGLVGPGAPAGSGVSMAPFFSLSELGFGVRVGDHGIDAMLGVRTIWDDPEDVVVAIEPVIAKAVRGEDITDDVKAVAAKFPASPYAADVRAGEVGYTIPVAFIGMAAAIVLPVLMDYLHTSR